MENEYLEGNERIEQILSLNVKVNRRCNRIGKILGAHRALNRHAVLNRPQ